MLEKAFYDLLTEYDISASTFTKLWQEIKSRHSEVHRHYHNLSHLNHLFQHINEVHSLLNNPQVALLSIFFHDIIYNPTKSDNEEQSALIAEKRLISISVPTQIIDQCTQMILATKSHKESLISDCNYFTDADLAILGSSQEYYSNYAKQIRQEYAMYDDKTYKAGRKKVLAHFLAMPRVFKTNWFYNKLEVQSRQNMKKEWQTL
jgi:predicted metal-dependent HD superfamily phosphohydrolase